MTALHDRLMLAQTDNSPEMIDDLDKPHARLLVIDDDKVTRSILEIFLKNTGYEVRVVQSGREALELLYTWTPDVICLDYMMPDMDGQTVARHIRARQDVIYIPIIMLTASNYEITLKLECLESGVDTFLSKPVTQAELQATIQTMLRVKNAQAQLLTTLEDTIVRQASQAAQLATQKAVQATVRVCIQEFGPALNTILATASELNQTMVLHPHEPLDTGHQQKAILQLHAACQQMSEAMGRLRAQAPLLYPPAP